MVGIMKPMLACTVSIDEVNYPCYVSPKLDGIRCLAINGVAYSRSMKEIRNKHIQKFFQDNNLDGLDGELIVGSTFSETSSAVMAVGGTPDFSYHVFDYPASHATFNVRLYKLKAYIKSLQLTQLVLVPQYEINNKEELNKYISLFLFQGYEGAITHYLYGLYKQGRSTPTSQELLKFKPFLDTEAVCIDYIEQMQNNNDSFEDELGRTKRSTHQAGMVGKDTLGALVVDHLEFGVLSIGTGFDDATRKAIWNNKDNILGKLIKFKYQAEGMKDKPRFPVYLGIRDELDT
jgi:DNA ligase-1